MKSLRNERRVPSSTLFWQDLVIEIGIFKGLQKWVLQLPMGFPPLLEGFFGPIACLEWVCSSQKSLILKPQILAF